jgi:hypothetical protein
MKNCCRLVLMLLAVAVVPCDGAAQARRMNLMQVPDVVQLLSARQPNAGILRLAREACIGFNVDAAAAELRRAGADDALIQGLRGVCNQSPAPPTTAARVDSGYVHIEGWLPAGWSRAVNQAEPMDQRRISMTPGRVNTVVLTAPGFCPETVVISVEPREQRTWAPVLHPRPWVGECPPPTAGRGS